MTLDEIRAALCKGQFSSLSITWNDGNGPNYETVAKMLSYRDDYPSPDSFISPEERQRCIETNSIWMAHWYPETPVRFHHISASTFEALHARLVQIAQEQS